MHPPQSTVFIQRRGFTSTLMALSAPLVQQVEEASARLLLRSLHVQEQSG